MGQRRTTVSVYEVSSFLRDANLAAFMLQFGDIILATYDEMRGEWRFDIMLDCKTFYSIPNWLDLEGRRLPVIVSGRKPAGWHCSEIGHLYAVCPGKKAPKKPDINPGTLSPVMANDEKEAPVVSPAVRATAPDSSVQAGRNLKRSWILKSGWTRSVNRLHDQSTLLSPKQPRNIIPPSTPPQKFMPPPLMTILKPLKKGPIPLSGAVRFASH